MLEKITRKIADLENSLTVVACNSIGNSNHNSDSRYVSIYDAMIISHIDLEEETGGANGSGPSSGNEIQVQKMEGLKRLLTDIDSIFEEGAVYQQTILNDLLSDLSLCEGTYASIIVRRNSDEGILDPKDSTKHLEPPLLDVYNKATSLIDTKSKILRRVQNVVLQYSLLTNKIADQSRVMRAKEKLDHAIKPKLLTLLNDKFFETNQEQNIIKQVQRIWAGAYLGGESYINFADQELSSKNFIRDYRGQHWQLYIKIGAIVVLLLWAFSECFNNETVNGNIWNDPTFAIFMCFGDLILLLLMWAVSMFVWKRSGIDFVKLLDLEDTEIGRSETPENDIFALVSNLSLGFLAVFITFNKARRAITHIGGNLAYAHAIPVILIVVFVYLSVSPTKFRYKWWHMLWRVLAAPFFSVSFRDGYIGDLLTSLVRVFIPLAFSAAYLLISVYAWLFNDITLVSSTSDHWWKDSKPMRLFIIPLITLLPLWFRLLQCLRRSVDSGKRWPHQGNALKYASAIVTISFAAFNPQLKDTWTWHISFVLTTLFQFGWDLTQDWGMLDLNMSAGRSSHGMRFASQVQYVTDHFVPSLRLSIRKDRLLGPLWVYVMVILCNLALRFAWTLTLLSNSSSCLGHATSDSALSTEYSPTIYQTFITHIAPLLAMAEILRRMVWGFFRLEHEHLTITKNTQHKHGSVAHVQQGPQPLAFADYLPAPSPIPLKEESMEVLPAAPDDLSPVEDTDAQMGRADDNMPLLAQSVSESGSDLFTRMDMSTLEDGRSDVGSIDNESLILLEEGLMRAVEYDLLGCVIDCLPYGDSLIRTINGGQWLGFVGHNTYINKIRLVEVVIFACAVVSIVLVAAQGHSNC